MKSYFQIVSKYKIQKYWKMFAEKKNKYKICTFINEKKACKYVVEYLDAKKNKD